MAAPILPPVPRIGKDGFQDPVWPKWLNNLHQTVTVVAATSPSSIAVASANGFTGTVEQPPDGTATITLQTSIYGVLKGNGQQLLPAIAGTDYLVSNQLIKVSGDATASGNSLLALTLANTPAARANLGLKTMATQDSGAVSITGGNVVSAAIIGTATNDNAMVGVVGEYFDATGSATTMTSTTVYPLIALQLTAGDWDVTGVTQIVSSVIGSTKTGISTSSNAFGALGSYVYYAAGDGAIGTPVARVSLAASATIYLLASTMYTTGTANGTGYIRARRAR